MPLKSTPQHLKYVKQRISQLRAAEGKIMSFCLLRRKGSRDVILHLDREAAAPKFKNPMTAHQILLKTAAFRFEDKPDLFLDISKVVTCTGTVTNTGKGLLFARTVPGRGDLNDILIACKALKLRDCMIRNDLEADAAQAVVDQAGAVAEHILSQDPSTWAGLSDSADPLALFDLFEDFALVMDNLDQLPEEQQARLGSAREHLEALFLRVEGWSPDGIEPVSDALAALGAKDASEPIDVEQEIQELEELEELEREHAFLESLPEIIHAESRLSLDIATTDGFTGWFEQKMRTAHTLREGYYRLITALNSDYGKFPVLLVSHDNTFRWEEHLSAISVGRILSGRFRRSRSLKRLVFEHNSIADLSTFRKALKAMGISSTAYILKDFSNFRKDFEVAKRAQLPIKEMLQSEALCTEFYNYVLEGLNPENLAYYLMVTDSPFKRILSGKLVPKDDAELYDWYIDESGQWAINLSDQERVSANAGSASTTNFKALAEAALRNLNDPFNRWQMKRAQSQKKAKRAQNQK